MAGTLVLTACDVTTSEHVSLVLQPGGADVDIDCTNGGCEQSARIVAELSLEGTSQLPDDATVTMSTYRVDYQVEGGPPVFSADTSVIVGWGQTVAFQPRIAGDEQRQWAAGQSGGGEVAGLGTLTLNGVDHDGAAVQVAATFEVEFGDFVTTPGGAGGGGAGTGGAGTGGAGGN
jgi:hypothetical protein